MIIGFTGVSDSGKTTTAMAMEQFGFKRVREYISDLIPPKLRIIGKTYDDAEPFIKAIQKLEKMHLLYEKSGENVIFDRTIYDSLILSYLLLTDEAYEEYYQMHKKIERRIHYDYLVFFEPIPLKNKLSGYEIMIEMLYSIKVRPKCDIICEFDTLENRINHILTKIGCC